MHLARTAIPYQQSAFAFFLWHPLHNTFIRTTENSFVFSKPHLLALLSAPALENWGDLKISKRNALVTIFWSMKFSLAKGSFQCTEGKGEGERERCLQPQFNTQKLELSLVQPSQSMAQFRSASWPGFLHFYLQLASFYPTYVIDSDFSLLRLLFKSPTLLLQAVMIATICGAVSGLVQILHVNYSTPWDRLNSASL